MEARIAALQLEFESRETDTLDLIARLEAEETQLARVLALHADPKLVALEETFGRLGDIRPPVVYTGFVTPAPAPDGRPRSRGRLGSGW